MSQSNIDTITTEVIRNALQSIAEEMGATLMRTSLSPNIKDRRDFSTAIYTKEGKLISQAEHIPVHLGLMPSVVEEVLELFPPSQLNPGDAILINDPYISGSHLPDIFLISPVFFESKLVAITGNVAHHIDVGGISPGSMSAKATEIFQEGLRLPGVKICKQGILDEELIKLIQSNVRTTKEVIGDLYAQIAANNVGEVRLRELFGQYGIQNLEIHMNEIMNYSDRRMRAAIKNIPNGSYAFKDYLENDGIKESPVEINVKVEIYDDKVVVDFEGTALQTKGASNAAIGVTKSSVYFAIKALLDPEIPPNYGTYLAIEIKAPLGSLVNPRFPASVSNANGTTAHRIADTVLGALSSVVPRRSMAACTGASYLVAIGGLIEESDSGEREYFSYIETYGGGQGATYGLDGMDGVQTQMSNTLNTPIEVIEKSYPLLVTEYGLVNDSGGQGQYRGGMGIMREVEVNCDEITLTLCSERTSIRPWGLFGGEEGSPSKCLITYPDGNIKELPSKATLTLYKGTKIKFQSAGGGGYGEPSKRDPKMIQRDRIEGKISH